jgi:hypothetical protein
MRSLLNGINEEHHLLDRPYAVERLWHPLLGSPLLVARHPIPH